MMEENDRFDRFLIPLATDESIDARTSLTALVCDSMATTPSSVCSAPSPQPRFELLLEKLRKGMVRNMIKLFGSIDTNDWFD